MKVWSTVVQRELNSKPLCLLVCNLVAMEWTAAITGDCVGLFWDFSLRRKILENHFRQSGTGNLQWLLTDLGLNQLKLK